MAATTQPHRHVRAALAPRMLLAALVLLLPLVVIAALVVRDKNAQIDAVADARHGIEYLLEGRLLLAGMGDAFIAGTRHGPVAQRAIDARFAGLLAHLAREGDAFGLAPRLAEIEAEWRGYTALAPALDRYERSARQAAIDARLLALLRYTGDRSGLSAQPTLESAYLGKLVIRQVPEAVVRIAAVRARLAARDAADAPQPDDRDIGVNDWSLTLAHDELVRDFRTVAALDPGLDRHLSATLAAFDATAHRFLVAVAGAPAGAGSARRSAAASGSAGAIAAPADTGAAGQPARQSAAAPDAPDAAAPARLGDAATATALALFDRAASGMQNLLDERMNALARTKRLALSLVVGTGLIGAVVGWLMLRALTRPLESEIAERKRAEQKARELAAIVESSHDSILVIAPDNTFTSWNRGAERLYGWRADEAIGQPTTLLAPPGLQDETPAAVAAALRNASTPTLETVRKRKDGSLVNVSLRTSPVYNDAGEVTGIAVIGRDIAARKQAEAALREKERALQIHVDQLSQAQHELRAHRDRLEELVRARTAEVEAQAAQLEEALHKEKEFNALQRKFVSMASHEFRTPLAIIDGSAQRLSRRADRIRPADIVDRTHRIRSAVSRMLTLIESTLSLSRIEEGKVALSLQTVDLAELVSEICDRQQEIAAHHMIRTDLAGLPPRIVGDPGLLDQVFTNLLSNAVKYAPDDPAIDVVGRREDATVAVSITDRGRGIPEDELSQLFGRFFRASTSHGISGTGIGLNLAREFVVMHGGTITVDSTVGAGTTFTVRLPVAAAQAADTDRPPLTDDDGARSVAA